MKKKLFVLGLIICMVFISSACVPKSGSTVSSDKTEVQAQSEPKVEVTQKYFETYLDYNDAPTMDLCVQYKNTGSVPVRVYRTDLIAYDANGTSLGSQSGYNFAPEILQPGETGYTGTSGFGASSITLKSLDQVVSIDANIKFDAASADAENTNLEISDLSVVPDPSAYGPGRAHIEGTVTNPSAKDAEYFHIIVGLFDATDKLIGTAYSQDNPLILSKGKTVVQCVSGWEGTEKWDTVTKLDGKGYTERYVD